MIITVLRKLEKTGDLKRLTNAGLISTKLYTYRDIYYVYSRNLKTSNSKMQALIDTAIEMKVSETTVWKAKKVMESE